MPLLPYEYLHLVNCPQVVTISNNYCICKRKGLPKDLFSYWESVFREDLFLYNSSLRPAHRARPLAVEPRYLKWKRARDSNSNFVNKVNWIKFTPWNSRIGHGSPLSLSLRRVIQLFSASHNDATGGNKNCNVKMLSTVVSNSFYMTTTIVGTVRARLSGFSVWVLVRTRAFRVRAFRAFRADFYQL